MYHMQCVCVHVCVFTHCLYQNQYLMQMEERGGVGRGGCMCGQKGWRSSYLWPLQMSAFFDCLQFSVHFGMNFAKLNSRSLSTSRQI